MKVERDDDEAGCGAPDPGGSSLSRAAAIGARAQQMAQSLQGGGQYSGTEEMMLAFELTEDDDSWNPSIWAYGANSVSYTHLTLPTICSV